MKNDVGKERAVVVVVMIEVVMSVVITVLVVVFPKSHHVISENYSSDPISIPECPTGGPSPKVGKPGLVSCLLER